MKLIALFIYLTVGVTFLTTAVGISSTQKQIGHYFGLPAYMGSVPEHVRAAILEGVPTGSSQAAVDGFLSERGIGTDTNSACRTSDQLLTCTIGLRSSFWKLVRETCTVSFDFGGTQRLEAVNVSSHYFGVWEKTAGESERPGFRRDEREVTLTKP